MRVLRKIGGRGRGTGNNKGLEKIAKSGTAWCSTD